MNTQTPEPARPPEPSRRPRGASPSQDPASPAASAPRGSSLRRRSLGRHASAAAVLVFAFGAALLGMPAAAQAVALVSNVQQPNTKYWTQVVGETAQGFRTGGNTGGYTLESIEIDFLRVWPSSDASNLRVTLWSATSGQRPAAFLATLTNPSDLSVNSGSNVKRFTAPPFTNLNADTMYFVRLSVSGSSRVVLDALETTGEDAGRAAGWSINNFVLQRSNGSTADWSHPKDGIVRIRVNGTAGTTTGTHAGPFLRRAGPRGPGADLDRRVDGGGGHNK